MSAEQQPPRESERAIGPTQSADYVRFVALGDSASCGVGDPTPEGWRGWARILADAIRVDHHVSFYTLATPGATVAQVRREQVAEAVTHRPAIASLVVGLNDVFRSTWDPTQIRSDLMFCAAALAQQGALLVTVRFHDHTRVLGIPRPIARPLRRRIDTLNDIYDEVHELYGTLRVDLAAAPGVYDRDQWAFDRLHPSERGHRRLAHHVGALLNAEGLSFPLPSLECTSPRPSRTEQAKTLLVDISPWLYRRLHDLAPWAARTALGQLASVRTTSG